MMTSTGLTLTLKVKVTSGKCSLHSWDHILVHPKKKWSRGCLRVRPDANANADADADANHSKTICRPPLKGVDIIYVCNKGLLSSILWEYARHRRHRTPDTGRRTQNPNSPAATRLNLVLGS